MLTSETILEAIDLINPAYNPDVASYYFPQPVLDPQPVIFSIDGGDGDGDAQSVAKSNVTLSDENLMVPRRSSVVCGKLMANQPDQIVMQNRKKDSQMLNCEICGISCNSKKVFDTHLLGRKHINQMKANYLDTSKVHNPLRIKPVEVAETNSVEKLGSSSLHGSKEVNEHTLLIKETGTDASMLELAGFYPPEFSEINRPKHLQSSTSSSISPVCGILCHSKEMCDGDMEGDEHTSLMKEVNSDRSMQESSSADPMEGKCNRNLNLLENSASGTSLHCSTCNIFSNSQASLETHLAGKKHALKVKHHALRVKNDDSLMVLPASIDHIVEASELKTVDHWKVTQSVYFCTSCNITCNSQTVYEAHLAGKKHASKVKAENNQSLKDPSSAVMVEIGEAKEHNILEASAATPSPKHCALCNVSCNSQDVFDLHLVGKKHVSKVRMTGSNASTCLGTNCDTTENNTPLVRVQDSFQEGAEFNGKPSIKLTALQDFGSVCPVGTGPDDFGIVNHPDYESDTSQKSLKRAKTVLQFAFCAICKIQCTSSELLKAHKLGKKHQRELEKLGRPQEDIIAPGKHSAVQLTAAPMDCDDANKINALGHKSKKVYDQPCSEGNSKANNQSVIQSSAPPEAKIWLGCTMCNVVCNSQLVLDMHLAGKKHALMLWKNGRSWS